jgi:hypothetical protein
MEAGMMEAGMMEVGVMEVGVVEAVEGLDSSELSLAVLPLLLVQLLLWVEGNFFIYFLISLFCSTFLHVN